MTMRAQFPLPDPLKIELEQHFNSQYRFSTGISWACFKADWRQKLDTESPTPPTVRSLIDLEYLKESSEYRILDGMCQLLLDCSYDDWMERYRNNLSPPPPPPPSPEPPPEPFSQRGRIENPDRFFGREDLLRQIFEQLGNGSSISLVGESQIGKSSILAMIYKLGPQRIQPCPDGFIDLNMELIRNEQEFYEKLCHELNVDICPVWQLQHQLRNKRYILCIDEMERMVDPESFTSEARGQLRGLADGANQPLTLVIASRSPLDELFPDSPLMTSPLSTICRQIEVPPFSEQVAREFLTHRLQGTEVTFNEAQITQLFEESGGNPGLLQRKADRLYRSLRDPSYKLQPQTEL